MSTTGRSGIALVMGGLFLVVGLGGVVAAWGAYFTDTAIERSGLRASAQLHEKYVIRAADGDSDHVIRYRFQPSTGPSIETTLSIGSELWDTLQEGQVLEIRYAADNPNRSFPAGAGVRSAWLAAFVSVICGAIGLFGGAVLWGSVRGPRSSS